MEEYHAYENEPHIQLRLKNRPDARQRILTDYGDILQTDGQYDKAVVCYRKALEVRNYLHMEDDFTACDLYLKRFGILNCEGKWIIGRNRQT